MTSTAGYLNRMALEILKRCWGLPGGNRSGVGGWGFSSFVFLGSLSSGGFGFEELRVRMSIAAGVKNVWDPETQEVHGGQTWRQCETFVEDFSVTTNPLGTPELAMEAVKKALPNIVHYPAADNDEALEELSKFMQFPKGQLLVGNGASE